VSLSVGSRVAQYRLERRLGAGGMGEVYLADDTRLGRKVAIKFLVAPTDEASRRRLLREARVVAGLDHSGICAVHEVGTDAAGGDFIVMQYVEGETLAARLRGGRMRPDDALQLVAHIAEALLAAHRHGIIHRDLKPQNIILTASGSPKLLDFGLALPVANTPAFANAITSSAVTDPNTVVGTPSYMAPEQVRNEPVDFRTDVFALGCVLYECLTGRRAFEGATVGEVAGRTLHVDPAPPSSIASELTPAHDALCTRMLHKHPAERFQSAEEALGAIRAVLPATGYSSARGTGSAPAPTRRLTARLAVTALAVAAVGLTVWWLLSSSRALPVPPAGAVGWYTRGVEALREGTYASARAALTEAVRVFPRYAQAHARLAEAHIALDDEQNARAELLKVTELVPNPSWLDPEDRLRFEGARAASLRDHSRAIDAYRQVAERQPRDAGRWLDVGRARESGGQRAAARETYARAVELDGQYAAARLRLGVLQVQAGLTADGFKSLDEALRLYRLSSRQEGEAETLLRRGIAFSVTDKFEAARADLDRVVQFARDPKYASQRVHAQVELARLAYVGGSSTDAEALARQAVADASEAGLQTLAASGLIGLANALVTARQYGAADAQLVKAIDLASTRGARRVEMTARLQQASLRLRMEKPADALALAAAPTQYFADSGDLRLAIDGKNIASRAHENLEQYDDAKRLALEALEFAEKSAIPAMVGISLESLAGQMTKVGRLPEALAYRERLEPMHRQAKDHSSLPFDLANRADLLIRLGRGEEAEQLLAEIDKASAAGIQTYVARAARVAQLRALRASVELRFVDVGPAAAAVEKASAKPAGSPPTAPGGLQLYSRLLAEHARAQLGRSQMRPEAIAELPGGATNPVDRREWSYWAAQTLLARREAKLAYAVASEALAAPGTEANLEISWRLAAVAALAANRLPPQANSASMRARVQALLDQLSAGWTGAAAIYLGRPDLSALRQAVQALRAP
jgi:predicted Ser/Thr protein kinase